MDRGQQHAIGPAAHVPLDVHQLLVQHDHDVAALERAADLLAAKDRLLLLQGRRIQQLERDQTTLIPYSRRTA